MSISETDVTYGVREFDLSVARTNERVDIEANNIAILQADDAVTARINSPNNAAVPIRRVSSVTFPIHRLYLTNQSGTGVLQILTGFAGASGATADFGYTAKGE